MNEKIATPNFDGIDPSQCINAKIRRLHRLINSAYQQKIKPFGLRGSMLSILFIIGKNKHINQKTIADLLVLDQSTMSRDLKKLIARGLVLAVKGQDSRHSQLELTKEGFLLLEEITPIWKQLHERVEATLGQFNINQIDAITAAIQANLDDFKV